MRNATYLMAGKVTLPGHCCDLPEIGVFFANRESRDIINKWVDVARKIKGQFPEVSAIELSELHGLTFVVIEPSVFERVCGKHRLDEKIRTVCVMKPEMLQELFQRTLVKHGFPNLKIAGGEVRLLQGTDRGLTVVTGPVEMTALDALEL